jgi:hypothetical protein
MPAVSELDERAYRDDGPQDRATNQTPQKAFTAEEPEERGKYWESDPHLNAKERVPFRPFRFEPRLHAGIVAKQAASP